MTRDRGRGRTSQPRYDGAMRERALAIADKHGAAEAARQTGVAAGTIRRWRHEAGSASPAAGVDPTAWAERKRTVAQETWTAAREALARVRILLEGGDERSERKAKDAALTLAILLDKSAALEQASALADERQAKLAEAQAEAIAEALIAAFNDLGLPRSAAIGDVIAHHLRLLEGPDAPRGRAPSAAEARDALRAKLRDEVREELRREEWEVEPLAELPAAESQADIDAIESAEAEEEVAPGEIVAGRLTSDDAEHGGREAEDPRDAQDIDPDEDRRRRWNTSAGPASVHY